MVCNLVGRQGLCASPLVTKSLAPNFVNGYLWFLLKWHCVFIVLFQVIYVIILLLFATVFIVCF